MDEVHSEIKMEVASAKAGRQGIYDPCSHNADVLVTARGISHTNHFPHFFFSFPL